MTASGRLAFTLLMVTAASLVAVTAVRADGADATGSSYARAHQRLPDGAIASSGGMRAWYIAPTDRYGHGILGDAIEAGGLAVEHGGKTAILILDESLVFEDLQPRLADLTGDGVPEIVTIQSHLSRGARVAVYRLAGGALSLHAASAHIGRARRWLNIAAIRDLDGDGAIDIAWVETPHIGGTLKVATARAGTLSPFASLAGVSNHRIGSRNLCLSVVSGDALILPSQGFDALVTLEVSSRGIAVSRRAGREIDPNRPLTRQDSGVAPLPDASCITGR